MKSTPITQRAATKYGSAPKNEEVTVDAGGKSPANFARMSPIKSTEDPNEQVEDSNKPKVSKRTEQVQDAQGNLMEATETTTTQPDIVTETIQSGDTGLDPLAKAPKGSGGENNPEWVNSMQSKLDQGYSIQQLADAGHGTVEGLTGLGLTEKTKPSDYMSTTTKGSESKEYEYKPVERKTNTFEIRDARRRDRNIKRAGRVMKRDLKKYGKDSKEYQSSKAAYDRFLEERKAGVNQRYQQEYDEKVKAGEGTQTQAEFEGTTSTPSTDTSSTQKKSYGDSWKNKFSEIRKKAEENAAGINWFGNDQSTIKLRNQMLDFGGNLNDNNFNNAPGTAYVDKTGQYRDNELEKAISAFPKNGKPASYKMGGFGSKNKNK